MKPIRYIFILLIALLTLNPLSLKAAEKTQQVGPFDAISAQGGVKVTYRCEPDSAGLAVIVNPEGADGVEISVKKGLLTIKNQDESANFANWPEVRVYSAYVTSLSSEKNARIEALLQTTVPEFSATVSGNGLIVAKGVDCTSAKLSLSTGAGKIEASGKTVELSCNLVGTGSIEAADLRAEIVKCRAMGTGSIGCQAIDTLDVTGLGSTRIFYKGNPDVKKTGAARLSRLVSDLPALKETAEEEMSDSSASADQEQGEQGEKEETVEEEEEEDF